MSDDELDIAVSPEGASLSVKGSSASRLANAIADLISPFSELAGTAGDVLRRFRIYREQALISALSRAKEIREVEQIPRRHVSEKLLKIWIEGASAEDVSSENITEAWARVLANSPEKFDANFAAYMEVLGMIGSREAELIATLFRADNGDPLYSIPHGVREENLAACQEILDHVGNLRTTDNLHEEVKTISGQGNLHFAMAICVEADIHPGKTYYVYPVGAEIFSICTVLERVGVIQEVEFREPNARGRFIQFVELTIFGFGLANNCLKSSAADA